MKISKVLQPVVNAAWAAAHPVSTVKNAVRVLSGNTENHLFWTGISNYAPNYTNKMVTDETVLQVGAMYSGVRLITEAMGTMPMHLYEYNARGDLKALRHPLYKKIHSKPHKYVTSQTFFEGLALSLCIWHTAYVYAPRAGIEGRGRVISLQVIPKPCVTPFFDDDGVTLKFRVQRNGKTMEYDHGEIIPIKGFGAADEIEGTAVAGLHRNAFGLAMALEEYAARFFGNGGRPSGVFTIDQKLTDDQRKQIRTEIVDKFTGSGNSHKTAVLESGMTWVPVNVPNDSAQFLESRKHQALEIARILRVPPNKMYIQDHSTFNNAELDEQSFQVDTLLPYMTRIEQALNAFLLDDADADRYYFKFNAKGRLRIESGKQAEIFRNLRVAGVISINEVRHLLDMPLRDDEGADDLLVPLNMIPSDKLGEFHDENSKGNSADD